MSFLLDVFVVAVFIHVLRTWLAEKKWQAPVGEAFKGELFKLGNNWVCVPDRSHLPLDEINKTTIVCFPGFLEDMRYFMEVYKDVPARLIIINNANYQNPFDATVSPTPDWFEKPPQAVGTIAHDAHCMNQVAEHMTGDETVVLHGHSRGGAVVLEAGMQQPAKAAKRQALLEAAVVPKGRLAADGEKKLQPVGHYLFPFTMLSLRTVFATRLQSHPMMWVKTPYKEKLVAAIPFTPCQCATAVVNSEDIINWQARTDINAYANYGRTTLVVGEQDHILSRSAMVKSAEQSQDVDIVATEGTDHFPSLERPELIQAYYR